MKIFITFFTVSLITLLSFQNLLSDNYSPVVQYPTVEADGSVLLPAERLQDLKSFNNIPNTVNDGWKNFKSQNPTWNILPDNITGKIHKAFGKPIKISGYNNLTENSAVEAALTFLNDNSSLLGINTGNLKLRNVINVNGLWSISFSQEYKGIEVLMTEVEVKINKKAEVISFGVDYYDNINLSPVPTISRDKAVESAVYKLDKIKNSDAVSDAGNLYILPVRIPGNIVYSLVYEIDLKSSDNLNEYTSYVDAHSGSLLWRRNMIADAETEFEIKGGVKLSNPLDSITVELFPDQYFSVGGTRYQADSTGKAIIDIDQESAVSASLESPYAKTNHLELENASFSGTATPGEKFDLLWDDDNSHLHERLLFYHANLAHDVYKSIDPVSKAMDFQLKVIITYQGSSNAGSNLQTGDITFTNVDNTAIRYAECPSVLYHEYGHSINSRLYQEIGISQGMINISCHEALADVNSALMLDDPRIGYGAWTNNPTRVIRNINNSRKYPNNVTSDSHITGLILSGALWDVREATSLKYSRWLTQFTKKLGAPDDQDLVTAFTEWFIETLVTDDASTEGDQDLSNGTPNAEKIIASFNKHGIGTDLLLKAGMQHVPYKNTDDTENNYLLEFSFLTSSIFGELKLDSVNCMYSIDRGKTYTMIPATEVGDYSFTAEIPAQKKGTIVDYYFFAKAPYTNSVLVFSRSQTELLPYEFLVGFDTAYYNNFESDHGWVVGSASDNVTNHGQWEFGIPLPVNLNVSGYRIPIQPNGDHSADNNTCFVTGAQNGNGNEALNYMPNGRTTLTSPSFDISGLVNPLLKYYNWFVNLAYNQNSNLLAVWRVQLSSDNGQNWVNIENTSDYNFIWQEKVFVIQDYVELTDQFKVRYIFDAKPNGTAPGTYGEGCMDDFEILSGNDTKVVSVDDFKMAYYSGLKISPNPADKKLQINIEFIGKVDIRIYNSFGELMLTESVYTNENGLIIHLENLSSGVYYISICNKFRNTTGKFIILR